MHRLPACLRRQLRLVLVVVLCVASPAHATSFFVMGDAPYTRLAVAPVISMYRQQAASGVDFVVHIGDIKSGRSPCVDEHYQRLARLFRELPVPVVYTPGDNEWTDCANPWHKFDPVERLSHLREVFYADPGVLHLKRLGAHVDNSAFPEIYWFERDGVLFASLHVVGSYNNRFPRRATAMREFKPRNAANLAMLGKLRKLLSTDKYRALVLFWHANVGLAREEPHPGFAPTILALRALVRDTSAAVLLVHGDTHQLRVDRPLRNGIDVPYSNFLRLEVPGFPQTSGLRVVVSNDRPANFQFQRIPSPLPE